MSNLAQLATLRHAAIGVISRLLRVHEDRDIQTSKVIAEQMLDGWYSSAEARASIEELRSSFNRSISWAHCTAEDARDAARYRWLRAQHWSEGICALVVTKPAALRLGALIFSREQLDAEIDTAMAQSGQSADDGILDGTNRTTDGTIGQP